MRSWRVVRLTDLHHDAGDMMMNLLFLKSHPLLARFNEEGPYYTSYPAMGAWGPMGHDEYEESLRTWLQGDGRDKPLHLYLHIPFCAKLCWYCVCNIVVTNNRDKIQAFLDVMLKEIDLYRVLYERIGVKPKIREMHFGGGTPSHLYNDQFSQLCDRLETLTGSLHALDEVSMEIDPRTTTKEGLTHYANHGVTRISFGVQDFDRQVQEAINRVQPAEMIDALLTKEIRALFTGVNFDLLYGLPKQTLETFRQTVATTLRMRPERVTLLKYAHAPAVRKHMKLIKDADLPPKDNLPIMFIEAAQAFMDAGYVWVGLDHFALPTDDLAVAHEAGKVHRTFNGYGPGRTHDMLGIGPTSAAAFGRTYAQNTYDFDTYFRAIEAGRFPIYRGYALSAQDAIIRSHIFDRMCVRMPVPPIERLFLRHSCMELDAHKPTAKYRMPQPTITHRITHQRSVVAHDEK